ncbi:MAG: hypothetical protein ACOC55_05050 [Candidatus Natronoplasma sp.]
MEKEKGSKEDTKVLRGVRALVTIIPFLLRLALTFLKYKRAEKKRKKIFKKTLRKEGLNKEVAEKLADELPDLKIRDVIKERSGGFNPLKMM